jgi:hypothetical protein
MCNEVVRQCDSSTEQSRVCSTINLGSRQMRAHCVEPTCKLPSLQLRRASALPDVPLTSVYTDRSAGSVGTVTRLRAGCKGTTSRPALGPTQCVPGAVSSGVNRQGREAGRSPPSRAEVKNMWSYTATPPNIFMTQSLKHRSRPEQCPQASAHAPSDNLGSFRIS